MSALPRQALRIAKKELTESFRDRQTIIYAVAMPLLLYPVVFFVLLQGWAFLKSRSEARTAEVVVAGAALTLPDDWEATFLGDTDEPGSVTVAARDEAWDLERAGEHLREHPDTDAVLTFDATADPPRAQLVLDSSRAGAELAEERLRERLLGLIEEARDERRTQLGLDEDALVPFRFETLDLATKKDLGGFLLSFMLPLFFVVMSVTGAFYPAVDMTAGERERKTLETTLALPVPPLAFACGKLAATAVLSLFAALLNLLGTGLAAATLLAGLPGGGSLDVEVPLGALVSFFPFAVLFTVFAASVILAAMSWAKTYRQGQSLFGGIQLAFFVPAMVTAMPGLALTPGLACVPVVGAVLLFKERLQSAESDPLAVLLATAALIVYAAIAVGVALLWTTRNDLEGSRRRLRLAGSRA